MDMVRLLVERHYPDYGTLMRYGHLTSSWSAPFWRGTSADMRPTAVG
jgi:hypothetical protein